MKNIEKLYNIVKNPTKYGTKKGTRVYKCICYLAAFNEANTGYSDRNTKHIETAEVKNMLAAAGVPCVSYNVAPRGGACGERVALRGRVTHDVLRAWLDFCVKYRNEHKEDKRIYECSILDSFIQFLQNH